MNGAISLIQHQDFHLGEIQRFLLDMIEQASWRGDQHFDVSHSGSPAPERSDRRHGLHATVGFSLRLGSGSEGAARAKAARLASTEVESSGASARRVA